MQRTEVPLISSEAGLIRRSVRASLVVTALVGVYGIFLATPAWALAYAACSLWNTSNVYLWHKLLEAFLIDRRKGIALLFAALKMPVLYAAGALFIGRFSVPLGAFLAGFNTIFIVIGLKILGKEYVAALAASREVVREKHS
jgi:hypothetical protein